ncbi:unnamed protein product [Heligmosomoides polygyrus]|uniref:TLDc domain-containing protein n=1 Tax=Heligmosomoides polygyrus TaxID=6339 RepID=A0A183GB64_HELPZ|nr:unnamed protein product [Heligmosomoides polygyrus]
MEVERYDDRLMVNTLVDDAQKVHSFPTVHSTGNMFFGNGKHFLSLLNEETSEQPSEDFTIVAGEMNGYVGSGKKQHSCQAVSVVDFEMVMESEF